MIAHIAMAKGKRFVQRAMGRGMWSINNFDKGEEKIKQKTCFHKKFVLIMCFFYFG